MRKRVVITGLGVLSSIGQGKDEFWQSLAAGKIGYKPITLFNCSNFNVSQAGEISDFDAKVYMGMKGLRNLDRSTKLIVSAAKQAIDDSGIEIEEKNSYDVGIAVGSTLGSIKSIAEFDEVTINEGPRSTNPALFPNTVINSPASQVSIWHKIKGFHATLSTGFTASIDAMQYAYDFIQWDRAKIIYAGGVEELCYHTFFGFHSLKFLSGSREGTDFVNCPFDIRRNGITFGEGAVMAAMEDYEHANKRKANILAEVISFGYSFDPYRINKYNPRGVGVKDCITDALKQAKMEPRDIDYICANANSTVADKIEVQAIKEVFGKHSKNIPISSIKSMIGECYSVSGAMSVAAGIGALNNSFIPPTMNYVQKDPECDLDFVPNQSRQVKLNNILVVNFGPNGNHTSVILRRFK